MPPRPSTTSPMREKPLFWFWAAFVSSGFDWVGYLTFPTQHRIVKSRAGENDGQSRYHHISDVSGVGSSGWGNSGTVQCNWLLPRSSARERVCRTRSDQVAWICEHNRDISCCVGHHGLLGLRRRHIWIGQPSQSLRRLRPWGQDIFGLRAINIPLPPPSTCDYVRIPVPLSVWLSKSFRMSFVSPDSTIALTKLVPPPIKSPRYRPYFSVLSFHDRKTTDPGG